MAATDTRSFLAYLGPETATLGLAAFKKIGNSKAFALMRNNGSAMRGSVYISMWNHSLDHHFSCYRSRLVRNGLEPFSAPV